MGTDIHLYVEYRLAGETHAWCDGALTLQRDYRLFGALAGVRSEAVPLFPLRGLPDDLSADVFERYYAFVIDPSDAAIWSGFSWVTASDAAALISSGDSHAPPQGYVKVNRTSPLGYVSLPGSYAATWLLRDELLRALEHAGVEPRADFLVLLDVLSAIEQRIPGASARAVFWFTG